MEGSVQSGGNRIRVNAQLIDAEMGAHLWAERFDKPRADLFDMQDEITTRLARAVGIELVAAEAHRAARERPNSMDAVDLAMRGRAIMNQSQTVDRVREARTLFEAALRVDDKNVDALVGFARSHLYELSNFLSDNPDEQLRVVEAALSKALRLAPDNAEAHLHRATALQVSKAPERALSECELAISLDRNLAGAHGRAGVIKIFLGRAEETEEHASEAMRLSPRDPFLCIWYFHMGAADLYLGRLDQAIQRLRKSVEISSDFELAYFYLAAALALSGRQDEADEACATGVRLAPTFSISRFRARAMGDNPRYLEQRERLYEGMRRAGVPER
jgi:tetratricopeptide (TPR) repeat protein